MKEFVLENLGFVVFGGFFTVMTSIVSFSLVMAIIFGSRGRNFKGVLVIKNPLHGLFLALVSIIPIFNAMVLVYVISKKEECIGFFKTISNVINGLIKFFKTDFK